MKSFLKLVFLFVFIAGCSNNQDDKILAGQENLNARLDSISNIVSTETPLSRIDLIRVSFDSLVSYNYSSIEVDTDTTGKHNHLELRYVEYYTFKNNPSNIWDGDWSYNVEVTENFDLLTSPESVHNILKTPLVYQSYGKYRINNERSIDMNRDGGQSYSFRRFKWVPLDPMPLANERYMLSDTKIYFIDVRGNSVGYNLSHLRNIKDLKRGLYDF